MTQFKQGDIIKNSDGKRKILGICGEVYFLSWNNDFEEMCFGMTIKELKKNGYTLAEQPRGKPNLSDKYYCIDEYGDLVYRYWDGDEYDDYRYSIGNCFKSKDDERIEVYKEMLLNIGKNIC